MASGRKDYFRHSFFARNDEVIVGAIEKFGFKAYFFWFALLELCGEQASDEYPEFFIFHQSRLYKELRCSKRTLNLLLGYLQDTLRVSYTYTEPIYKVRVHNLPKFMGKYQSKFPPNTSNKRKENKIKVNEIKVKESSSSSGDFVHEVFSEMPACHKYLRIVPKSTQDNWVARYDAQFLKEKIDALSRWLEDNPTKKRSIGPFFGGCLSRDFENWKSKNTNHLEELLKKGGITPEAGYGYTSNNEG